MKKYYKHTDHRSAPPLRKLIEACRNLSRHFVRQRRGHWSKTPDVPSSPSPLVSVIVPTRCRPEMLREAVNSILRQTFRDFEVVIVNDGGPDLTSVLSRMGHPEKIVYLRHEAPLERSQARNTGLAAARGKYIAYLDDDDVYYCNHLQRLITTLEQSGRKVAYSNSCRARQTHILGRYLITKRKPFPSPDFDAEQLLISNYIPNLCVMHEKACVNVVGAFDPTLSTHEDWEFLIRLSRAFPFAHLNEITCEFRFRNDNSNTTSQRRADFLRTAELIYQRYSSEEEGNRRIIEGRNFFIGQLKKELAAVAKQEISR